MKEYDVVIVGGGPAGLTTGISARNTYPDKKIALIRKEEIAMIPCGIPYTIHTLEKVEDDILPDAPINKNNIDLIIDRVVNASDHSLELASGEKITFRKLVIATGSVPFTPPIPGIDKKNVWFVKKEKDYLEKMKNGLNEAGTVIIIGGGFIGIEVADELLKAGKKVYVIEKLPSLLPLAMDREFGDMAKEVLTSLGAEVLTGVTVKEITGAESVDGVLLDNDKKIAGDAIVIAAGYRPNLELAKDLELKVEERYGIVVDEYLRTSREDIFAVGDCAVKRCCFTGEYSKIMLASTAMAQGRLAGSNLFEIKVIKGFLGTLGTFSTKIGNTAFGVSGLTEEQVKRIGIDYVVGINETVDRHPGKLPGASKIYTKLIYSKYSHILLGAQVKGGDSVGELVNMYSVIIQNRMTDMEIDTLQIGTHPLLTSSPIAYPVINATVNAILKWYKG